MSAWLFTKLSIGVLASIPSIIPAAFLVSQSGTRSVAASLIGEHGRKRPAWLQTPCAMQQPSSPYCRSPRAMRSSPLSRNEKRVRADRGMGKEAGRSPTTSLAATDAHALAVPVDGNDNDHCAGHSKEQHKGDCA